jgi:hypothetical protein
MGRATNQGKGLDNEVNEVGLGVLIQPVFSPVPIRRVRQHQVHLRQRGKYLPAIAVVDSHGLVLVVGRGKCHLPHLALTTAHACLRRHSRQGSGRP